jgi:hypothetical protein
MKNNPYFASESPDEPPNPDLNVKMVTLNLKIGKFILYEIYYKSFLIFLIVTERNNFLFKFQKVS